MIQKKYKKETQNIYSQVLNVYDGHTCICTWNLERKMFQIVKAVRTAPANKALTYETHTRKHLVALVKSEYPKLGSNALKIILWPSKQFVQSAY